MDNIDIQTIRKLIKKKRIGTEQTPIYPLIGEGNQGAVFLLTHDRCIKIYKRKHYAKRELRALSIGQSSSIVPRLYKSGTHYIIMEYLHGPTLAEYLSKKSYLSEGVAKEILFLLGEMNRLKFTRVDAALRHIYVMKNGKLKVIDLVNSYKKVRSKPTHLLKGLKNLGMLSEFLSHLEKLNPTLYKQWTQL